MSKKGGMEKTKNGFFLRIKDLFLKKWKEIVLLIVLALALLFAVWQIFKKDDNSAEKTMASLSQSEVKVAQILEEIDGVGEASVVVCESENGVESVVVVCEGANNLRVVMNVREAVAAALGTEEKAVKIYLKKE